MTGEMEFFRFATHAVVAVGLSVVAVTVLVSDHRRNWNRFLAFFLLLVAGNFAMQAVDAYGVLERATGGLAAGATPQWTGAALSVAYILLILDPPVLAYFACIFPRRTAFATSSWASALLFAPTAVFLPFEILDRRFSAGGSAGATDPVRFAFLVYLAGCYAFAAARLLANYLNEPSSVMAQQLHVVTFGMLVAAVPRVALFPSEVSGTLQAVAGEPWPIADLALRVAILWGLFAAFVVWALRAAVPPERRKGALRLLMVTAPILAAFTFIWAVERVAFVLGQAGRAHLEVFSGFLASSVVFTIRWAVFSSAMVYGVVRYQVLSTTPRALGAATGAGLAVLGLLLGGAGGVAFGPWAGAFIAAALLVPGMLVASWIGRERRGHRKDYLHDRSLEVYRALLAAALAAGPVAGERRYELLRARDRLGISDREHEVLLAIAETEEGRPRPVALGRYELVRRLGAGGYATVHLARDTKTGSLVVFKRVREEWVGGPEALDATLREMEVARRVSHPNVVPIHEMVRLDDGAVIVMDYAEGGSLRDVLSREGTLPTERVAGALRDALSALAAVHDAGVVHGDLKPENLLLSNDGRTLLADFGAARDVRAHRTLVQSGTSPRPGATPVYMAPEWAHGLAPTPQSDLYALGAIAYEAMTGRVWSTDAASAKGAPHVDAAAGWEPFLARALAEDPAARYRSAQEMLGALDLAVGGGAPRGKRRGRKP